MSELEADVTREVTALARDQIAALRDHGNRAGTPAAKHEARALSQQVVRGVQRWHDRHDNLMAIVATMRATVAYVDRVERQVAMRRLRQEATAAKLKNREFWVRGADLERLRADIDRWLAADPRNSYRRLARAAGLYPIDVSRAHKVNRRRVNWHTASAIWEALDGV